MRSRFRITFINSDKSDIWSAFVLDSPIVRASQLILTLSLGHCFEAKAIMHCDQTEVEKISRTIRSLRMRLGLSQPQLGRMLAVRANTIYKYETQRLKPSRYILLLLWRISETEDELRAFRAGLDLVGAGQVGGRRAAQERAS
jgi:DNA-binding transcriptional regulator YiaG